MNIAKRCIAPFRCLLLFSLSLILLTAAGCGSNPYLPPAITEEAAHLSDTLQADDQVTIQFSGIPYPPRPHQTRVKKDGTINLPLVETVHVAGLSAGQLEEKLEGLYVPRFYKQLTINVLNESRYFYVSGEVKSPNRYAYSGELTILKAIAAAGDFTDFANRKRVQLTRRNGETFFVNCVEAGQDPSKDLPVLPGDKIYVSKRII